MSMSAVTDSSPTLLLIRITMFAVIDMQGFKTERDFVVKEIAIRTSSSSSNIDETSTISHWIFEPPYFWNHLNSFEKCQASWLAKHHHGLRWSDGCVPFWKLPELLASALANIDFAIVKGAEKKTWMLQLLSDIIVEDICDVYKPKGKKITNARTVEDDGGYDVDDDYCGITPDSVDPDVPNLKSMASTNTSRCAFDNDGGVCALENVHKVWNYIRSDT